MPISGSGGGVDLERLSVRLRPRKPWEAVDLGFAMVRTWRGTIYGPWLTLTVPVALVLIWTLGVWGLLLFWWLLPLFEASILRPLSRAVFGELPDVRDTLRAAPGEMKGAWREVALRRLHPARSFSLPIGQLEGLDGTARRLRRTALSRAIDVHGNLTVVFLCFEIFLFLAFLSMLAMMTPPWFGVDWGEVLTRFFEGQSSAVAYRSVWSAFAFVIIAVDPFYVAAGFALYLDRRTALEGWDLEIAFRRLARKLQRLEDAGTTAHRDGRSAPRPAVWWVGFGVAALLTGLAGSTAQSASAQDTVPAEEIENLEEGEEGEALEVREEVPAMPPAAVWEGDSDEDPRVVAREITARPEFGGTITVSRWQLRDDLRKWLDKSRDVDSPEEASKPHPVMLGIARFLIWLSEFALWLIAGVIALGVVGLAIRKWPGREDRLEGSATQAPDTLFGLDLRSESLPADIAGEAERLWRAGDITAAMSLLYRGALARIADEGVVLAESFTEDDCLRAARARLDPVRTGFLAELTRAWQGVAYGHRPPNAAKGEDWWLGWRRHFDAPEPEGVAS
ncbi:MAG: DUF4129 domain-containing protein [Thermoanaerobaculia bacterium]|nr:DUF4129 domain-containing protein [Thermoanaerobaculia bacterium]